MLTTCGSLLVHTRTFCQTHRSGHCLGSFQLSLRLLQKIQRSWMSSRTHSSRCKLPLAVSMLSGLQAGNRTPPRVAPRLLRSPATRNPQSFPTSGKALQSLCQVTIRSVRMFWKILCQLRALRMRVWHSRQPLVPRTPMVCFFKLMLVQFRQVSEQLDASM